MRNKRKFNNLLDSIFATILLVVEAMMYTLLLWVGKIQHKEGVITFLILTAVFGVPTIIIAFMIVKYCYEYWILSDDSIISKKLFAKRKTIKLTEIVRVEKKIVDALIFDVFKSEAYVIYSDKHTITILLNERRKKYPELDCELAEFLN